MRSLLLYRILSYALLIVAGFLALMLLAALPAALANPVLLLFVFLMACVIIYSYSSWRFLSQAIDKHQYCKPRLRDLIKVNSYFALGIGLLFVLQGISLMADPNLSEDAANQAMANIPAEANFSKDDVLKLLRFMERFFLIYGFVLVTHIFLTWRLLRQHRDAFDLPKEPE